MPIASGGVWGVGVLLASLPAGSSHIAAGGELSASLPAGSCPHRRRLGAAATVGRSTFAPLPVPPLAMRVVAPVSGSVASVAVAMPRKAQSRWVGTFWRRRVLGCSASKECLGSVSAA